MVREHISSHNLSSCDRAQPPETDTRKCPLELLAICFVLARKIGSSTSALQKRERGAGRGAGESEFLVGRALVHV